MSVQYKRHLRTVLHYSCRNTRYSELLVRVLSTEYGTCTVLIYRYILVQKLYLVPVLRVQVRILSISGCTCTGTRTVRVLYGYSTEY